MPYRICDLELSEPITAIELSPEQDGLAVLGRWRGDLVGLAMAPSAPGVAWSEAEVEAFVEAHFARSLVYRQAVAALAGLRPAPSRPAPSLTIAVCTSGRPKRVARVLASIDAVRARHGFAALEILVVDNALEGDATRLAAEGFAGVRYLREAKPGLNFTRNAAIAAAGGDLLAFLDDDMVVDRNWLDGLLAAWTGQPDAGGYTGLELPLRLDTPAEIRFEAAGGFNRGFRPQIFNAERWDDPLHPARPWLVGAGGNMAFDRRLLLELGGFDEGLDAGPILPAGGDLDIFCRVLRSGRSIVYEPQFAAYHEHRETLPQLRGHYAASTRGLMGFLAKTERADPALRPRLRAVRRAWVARVAGDLAQALRRRRWGEVRFALAEIKGGVRGLFGEYDRASERAAILRAPNP